MKETVETCKNSFKQNETHILPRTKKKHAFNQPWLLRKK